MKAIAKKQFRRARGQGMTEYIIIVALIAIATVGVVTLFGNNIRRLFGASAGVLSGTDQANTAKTANGNLMNKKMQTFGQQNSSAF